MKTVNLTIAGTCTGDAGPGGWAFVLRMDEHSMERTGGSPQTTRGQMELNAVMEGLKALRERCQVFLNSDNEYLLNGIPFGPTSGDSLGMRRCGSACPTASPIAACGRNLI